MVPSEGEASPDYVRFYTTHHVNCLECRSILEATARSTEDLARANFRKHHEEIARRRRSLQPQGECGYSLNISRKGYRPKHANCVECARIIRQAEEIDAQCRRDHPSGESRLRLRDGR